MATNWIETFHPFFCKKFVDDFGFYMIAVNGMANGKESHLSVSNNSTDGFPIVKQRPFCAFAYTVAEKLWKLNEIRLFFCNIVRIKTMLIFKVLLIGSFIV